MAAKVLLPHPMGGSAGLAGDVGDEAGDLHHVVQGAPFRLQDMLHPLEYDLRLGGHVAVGGFRIPCCGAGKKQPITDPHGLVVRCPGRGKVSIILPDDLHRNPPAVPGGWPEKNRRRWPVRPPAAHWSQYRCSPTPGQCSAPASRQMAGTCALLTRGHTCYTVGELW